MNSPATNTQAKSYRSAFAMMVILFFMWGFITCMNDILVPHLKALFNLDYAEAMLVQFCFFATYAVMSLPMAAILEKISYKSGMVLGLITAGVGCFLFVPAAHLAIYGLFLLGLFVLATGVVMLQVTANPYVTLLGKPQLASSRLTLAQAMNSLGTTIAPQFGAALVLSTTVLAASVLAKMSPAQLHLYHTKLIHSVQTPYLLMMVLFFIIAILIFQFKLPKLKSDKPIKIFSKDNLKVFKDPLLTLGAIAIFVYVGAEVSTGSLIVNFLNLPNIMHMDYQVAAKYVSFYWGGAMIGRFIGSIILKKINPAKVILFNSLCAIALYVVLMFTHGKLAMWAILAIGLFNSIQFPTIFALAVSRLGDETQFASGVLCTAIVGGAFVPLLQGILADHIGLQYSFIIPLMCYLFIGYFGLKARNNVRGV